LEKLFPEGTFEQSEELDQKCHCDIKMTMNDRDYYFWSFCSSARSIYNFADKFKGNRAGHVLNGLHVLCPFDNRAEKNKAQYKGWLFYSKKYMEGLKKSILDDEMLSYEQVLKTSVYDLDFYRTPSIVNKKSDVEQSIEVKAC
jgi:hypothetical protein